MKKYYKIVDGKIIFANNNSVIDFNGVSIFNPTDEYLLKAGYQEYIEGNEDNHNNEYDAEKLALCREMKTLKQDLADGDYKIIKCFEAFMTDKKLPYDLANLIVERDNMRNRINEIENLLKK